jgi:predicted permease
MGSDLRIAVRSLAKSPAFALTAVLALALGIGANTAIFSVVNAILLNPSGIHEADRLVAIRVKYDKLNLKSIGTSAPDFADVRDSKQLFSSAAMIGCGDFNYKGDDLPQRLVGTRASWQFFETLGGRPLLGRAFTAGDDQPERNRVVILSHPAWQRLFGGDPSIVGRKIELNDQPHEVVGVMGPRFRWPPQADLWVPFGFAKDFFGPNNRHNQSYFTFARMRPGVGFEQALAGVRLLGQQIIEREDERGYAKDSGWGLFAVPLLEQTAGSLRAHVLILLGAVAFVLLVACANIAGLMLARGSEKARDVAVRAALGAGRWRLIRQTLAESVLLAGLGTLLGSAMAFTLIRLLPRLAADSLQAGNFIFSAEMIPVDRWVLGFTAGVGILSGIVFGLAPAWQIARVDRYEALKEGGRSGSAGRARQRLRCVLVTGEVALALVLLVGAGLFLRSLARLQEVDTGFRPEGVMSASLTLPQGRYGDNDKIAGFYRTLLPRLSSLPGVVSAAVVTSLPFSGSNSAGSFQIEGRETPAGEPGPHGDVRSVSPAYFTAMGIPLRRGRLFGELDVQGGEPVALVDELLARQYWPNEDALGKRIRRGNRPWAKVVGVVGHVRHTDLAADSGKGVYYFPLDQAPQRFASIVLKASVEPSGLAGPMRGAVREVDPSQPLYDPRGMQQRVQGSLGPRRFAVTLLGGFAATALLLSALGLYGVISYSVAQRTQEIGVRMALGAQAGEVLSLVLRGATGLALAGVAIGLVASYALARALQSQLFEVSPFDPLTFAWTAAVLVLVSLLASYLPARRATRVDPLVALRYE